MAARQGQSAIESAQTDHTLAVQNLLADKEVAQGCYYPDLGFGVQGLGVEGLGLRAAFF